MARTGHIRRKDLRRPDEFVTWSRWALAYAEENRTTLYLVAGAIVVVVAATVAYRAAVASREASAGRAYREAHALLDQKKYTDAATAFQQVADSYGSTSYAPLARLEAANANLLGGQLDTAATGYQRFLDASPPTTDLRQLALTRLGNVKEQTGAVDDAEHAYTAAADIQGPFAQEALLGAARVAEQRGDTTKAKERYEQFLAKYPTSDQRGLVIARLVALGWTPDAEKATRAAEATE